LCSYRYLSKLPACLNYLKNNGDILLCGDDALYNKKQSMVNQTNEVYIDNLLDKLYQIYSKSEDDRDDKDFLFQIFWESF
jgi:hypothetical protein